MGPMRVMASPRSRRTFPQGHVLLEHLAGLPVAVIETDGDGLIRTWAGAAERIFGWSEAQVLGTPLDALELVHEDDLPFVDAVIDRLRSGRDRHLVHRSRIRTRIGDVRHCEWTRIVLDLRTYGRPALLSYVLDVTAQVEAETTAVTARADLESWIRGSPQGCCGLDRDCRITHWNPAAERMLERSRAEVIGRELWEVLPELRDTSFHRAFDEALQDGYQRTVEDRAPRGRAWYDVTVVPSSRGLYVYFADVTGRRQLEKEFLALEEAKRARER